MAERSNIAHSFSASKEPRAYVTSPKRLGQCRCPTCPDNWPLRGMDHPSPEHACGFDPSQRCSDEGPPVGEAALEPRAEAASENAAWVLRWNSEGCSPWPSLTTGIVKECFDQGDASICCDPDR
jgi:hypothetical protein